MRVYSKQIPPAVRIFRHGEEALLRFSYDLRVEEGGFSYREAGLTVPFERELEKRIEGNEEAWRELAIEKEQKERAGEIRKKRNDLLRESDWTQMADSPLGEEEKKAWAEYRKALRDLPESEGFPEDVMFPALREEGV